MATLSMTGGIVVKPRKLKGKVYQNGELKVYTSISDDNNPDKML